MNKFSQVAAHNRIASAAAVAGMVSLRVRPAQSLGAHACISWLGPMRPFLENATVRGRAWYTLLDAPVLTLDVTV